ncbi:hypothetical protein NC653_006811 [Populus alba x Populus x berolinensis]|uniref:Uncharacterized protein n=1 Tax=Populus alba x Populus x berolinensis TaxID=444605 RepID=A0AAD6RFQ2_9ROSI|nr:hypothetical protein NC653_006811 [Populus alba x Populus x berolinensis]
MRNPHRCIQRDERRNKGKASDSESTRPQSKIGINYSPTETWLFSHGGMTSLVSWGSCCLNF